MTFTFLQTYKPLVKAFTVGSSFVLTGIPLLYMGNAYHFSMNPLKSSVPFGHIMALYPFLMGLFNAAGVWVSNDQTRFGGLGNRRVMYATGGVFGLSAAIIGGITFNMTERVFDWQAGSQWFILILSPLVYAVLWGTIGHWINQYFGLYTHGGPSETVTQPPGTEDMSASKEPEDVQTFVDEEVIVPVEIDENEEKINIGKDIAISDIPEPSALKQMRVRSKRQMCNRSPWHYGE